MCIVRSLPALCRIEIYHDDHIVAELSLIDKLQQYTLRNLTGQNYNIPQRESTNTFLEHTRGTTSLITRQSSKINQVKENSMITNTNCHYQLPQSTIRCSRNVLQNAEAQFHFRIAKLLLHLLIKVLRLHVDSSQNLINILIETTNSLVRSQRVHYYAVRTLPSSRHHVIYTHYLLASYYDYERLLQN